MSLFRRYHWRVTIPITPDDLPGVVARLAESEGWRAAFALLTANWDRLISDDPHALLLSIKALPGEAFIELPSLLVAVNYLQHVINGDDPRRFHDFAHDAAGTSGRERDLLDRLIGSAGRTAGHRTGGRFDDAVGAALEGRRVLDGMSSTQRAEQQMALPHLLMQWGRSFEAADQGGVAEYEQAWELATLSGQPHIARRAAASLAWLHADHGRLNEAETWIDRGRGISAGGPRYDAPLHLAAALVAIDRLDRDSALGHLAELASVPLGEYWAADAWVRGWSAVSDHDIVEVERLLAGYRLSQADSLRQGGAHVRYLAASEARLRGLRGKNLVPLAIHSEPSAFSHILSSTVAYRSGSMHAALHEAGLALAEEQSPRLRSAGLLLSAAAQLRLRRFKTASKTFTTAHVIIESERLYSSYSTIAPEDLQQLSASTDLPITPTHEQTDSSPTVGVVIASLSRRERQVLVHLASELSAQSIADSLFISRNTVKTITTSLYRKLGVNSRQAAVDVAHRAGIV